MAENFSPSPENKESINKTNSIGFIDDFLKQLDETGGENGLTQDEKTHIERLKATHKNDTEMYEKEALSYLASLYGDALFDSYGGFVAETLAIKYGIEAAVLKQYFQKNPQDITKLVDVKQKQFATVLLFSDHTITIQNPEQKKAEEEEKTKIRFSTTAAIEQEKQQLSREVMYDGALILGLAAIANTTHHFVKDVWIKTNTGIDHIEFSQGEITGTKSSIKTRILYELTKQRGFFLNPADKLFHKSENYLKAREIRNKYGVGNLSNITYEDYKWMIEVSGDTSSLSFEEFTQAQQNLVGYEQRLKADYQAYLRTTNSPMSEIEFFTQRQYIESVGKMGLGSASLNVLFMPYIFSPLRDNGEDITSIIKIAHDEAAFLVGGKATYNAWEKIPLERGGVVGKGIKGVGGILAYMGGGIAGMQIAPSSLQALGVNLDKKAWKYMSDREGESGQKSVLGHILTLGALNDLADKYDINIGVPGFEPLQLAKTDVDFATNPRIYLNNRISDTSLWDERIERFSQIAGGKIYDLYLKLQDKAITQEDFSHEIINILYGGIPPTQAEDILYLSNLISTLSFEGEKISQDDFTKFFHDTAQSKKLTPDNIQKLQEKNDLLLSEIYVKTMKLPEDKKKFTEKLIERIIHEKNLLEANNVTFTPTNTLMGFQSKVEISQERKFYDELIDSPDGDLFVEILNQAVAYKRENVFLRNISLNGYAQNWTLLPKNKNMAENAEKNIPAQNEIAKKTAEKAEIAQETQANLAEEFKTTEKRDLILTKMDETFVQFSSVFKEVLDHNIIKPKIYQYNILKEKVKACQSDGDLKKINGEVRKLIGDLKRSMLETPDLSWEDKLKLLGKVDRDKASQTQELAGHNIVEVESILDQLDGISEDQIAANKKERIEAIAKQTSQETGTEKEEFTKMLSGMGVPAAASGMIVGLASMMGFISDDPNKPSFFATILEFFKDPMGAFGRMLAGEPILKPKTNISPVETTSQETQTAQVKTTETNTGVEEKKSKIETIGNIQKYNGENFTLTMKDGRIDEITSKTGVTYEANIKGVLDQYFQSTLSLQSKEDGSIYITGDNSRNEIPLSVIEEKFAQKNLGDEIEIMKGYTREGTFTSQKDLYFEKKGAINGFFS